jgi:hypothetical protein
MQVRRSLGPTPRTPNSVITFGGFLRSIEDLRHNDPADSRFLELIVRFESRSIHTRCE